jgi:glycolate oxidase FAD binding subunit
MTSAIAGAQATLEAINDAYEAGTPLRISGRGHWMDAGRPSTATRILSLTTHSGVVDYVPGDLTITVRSGTTLSDIERITGAEGQWFPLDPYGTTDGTIGATIATGSFGPLAHGFGKARDLVLGLEFITGDGKVARGGGRVVKNVAGFDLTRLLTGSWGTLGVITEATLRLYSLPASTATIGLNLPDGAGGIAQRIASILNGSVTPLALEIVDAKLALRIGLPPSRQVLVRLGGNPASVAAQRDALAKLGGAREVPPEVWTQLRAIDSGIAPAEQDAGPPVVVRLSTLPARIGELWMNTERAAERIPGAMLHSTPSLGVLRCVIPSSAPAEAISGIVSSTPGATVIYERLPAPMWQSLGKSGTSDRLAQGIKKAFDPKNILNPGILGPLA